MFETVIVPIDGSALSRRALPAAAAIATAGRAQVRLVSVAHNDGELAWTYDQLHAAAQQLPADLTAAVDVFVDGDPASVLLDLAGHANNVLCFGSHDHTRLVTDLVQSVGSRLVEASKHPFVVVGIDGTEPVAGAPVTVALDGVSDPSPLLSTAGAWAACFGAPLHVVTVYEPTPADLRQPGHYSRRHGPPSDPDVYLDEMRHDVERLGVARVTVAAIPDPVSVAAGLSQHLADHPAFLLVVGAHKERVWPSSVLRDLLRGSPPPIVVAR